MENPLMSLYGTEWRERGYGLWKVIFKDKLYSKGLFKIRIERDSQNRDPRRGIAYFFAL
jgi:hypothetical protein